MFFFQVSSGWISWISKEIASGDVDETGLLEYGQDVGRGADAVVLRVEDGLEDLVLDRQPRLAGDAEILEVLDGRVERERRDSDAAPARGLDGEALGVDRLDGETADTLRSKFNELIKTGEHLYRVNQQTIYLINFSLDLVERQISAWTGAMTEPEGYGDDGQSRSGISDAKIVEEKA